MVEAKSDSKVKKIVFKALKAIIKGAIVYGIYILVWMFLSPISEYVPELQLMIEAFIIVYISLMIIEEIASGTVFKYFFNLAKSLFVIGYLIFSLKSGVFGITFQKVSITIDLRLFLTIAMLLSLLGLSKSVLQAVNYMSERPEVERI